MISKANCWVNSATTSSRSAAPLVSANSAEVPSVTSSPTRLMNSASIPSFSREVDREAAVPAPIAAPRKGMKKISPNKKPQKAPPSAISPMRWSCGILGFLLPSGQLTTAASSRVIIFRSCMPCRAISVRAAARGSSNFSTDSVAIASLLQVWIRGCSIRLERAPNFTHRRISPRGLCSYFGELRQCEVRRMPLPRTPVHKSDLVALPRLPRQLLRPSSGGIRPPWVAHYVDHHSVWVKHKEASHSPTLIAKRVHDLNPALHSLGMHSIDVGHFYCELGHHWRRSITA